MSQCSTRSRIVSTPFAAFRSTATERLATLTRKNGKRCDSSLPGRSTLITSAPNIASAIVAEGPAT